jgi:hypothetical protein
MTEKPENLTWEGFVNDMRAFLHGSSSGNTKLKCSEKTLANQVKEVRSYLNASGVPENEVRLRLLADPFEFDSYADRLPDKRYNTLKAGISKAAILFRLPSIAKKNITDTNLLTSVAIQLFEAGVPICAMPLISTSRTPMTNHLDVSKQELLVGFGAGKEVNSEIFDLSQSLSRRMNTVARGNNGFVFGRRSPSGLFLIPPEEISVLLGKRIQSSAKSRKRKMFDPDDFLA